MKIDTIEYIHNTMATIVEKIETPFYYEWEFWISIIIGLASVGFSIIAFLEARKARLAASEAGRTVKIQTITIELTELIQKLDTLDTTISYSSARDLFNEINRRVRRITAPFKDDVKYQNSINSIKTNLTNIKTNLNEVRPLNDAEHSEIGFSVYNATEGNFTELSGNLAELMGLFEKRTIETA